MSTLNDLQWTQYPRDRKIANHPSGFVVILPNDIQRSIPLTCPLCKYALRTKDDEMSYNEFECCNRCEMIWAASRRDEWKAGWRPTEQEINEREIDRLPLAISIDIE